MTSGGEGAVVSLLVFALALFLVAGPMLAMRRRRRRGEGDGVPDGPEAAPYRAYTRQFDLALPADRVLDVLPEASPDRAKGFLHRNPLTVKAWSARTDALVAAHGQLVEARLPEFRAAMAGLDPDDVAVALLIDQSGSMKGEPIAHAAAAADIFARLLGALGVRSEILGFSTAGWHGGKAFEAWQAGGRPARPGRLCALLHIVYKDAAAPALTDDARRTMVHPDLLRENVDGEAVLWAEDRLSALPVLHRLLVVMSDGAPVDDATLMHNGPSFLHRHIIKVVREVGEAGVIVGGVGVLHDVQAYYPRSRAALALDDLPAATVDVLAQLLAEAARG